MLTLDQVEEALIDNRKKAEQLAITQYDKQYENNPYRREIQRLNVVKEFLELGADIEWYDAGSIIVKGSYIYSLKSGKWRVKGKNKWYRSRDPEHFLSYTTK